MDSHSPHNRSILARLRRLAFGLSVAGLPVLGGACIHPEVVHFVTGAPVAHDIAVAGDGEEQSEPPENLPAPKPELGGPVVDGPIETTPGPKPIPISLDTIFRIGEEQNPQVRLAREKVNGACADLDVARQLWIPRLFFGPSYYRHEGGIQDQNGKFIHSSTGAFMAGADLVSQLDLRDFAYQRVKAEREVWQQKGELSKITSDQLLEATQTYIDLLTARSADRVAKKINASLQKLLDRAQKSKGFLTGGQIEAIQTEVANQRQVLRKVTQMSEGSTAKLAYLLGLGPCIELLPAEGELIALRILDPDVPACKYVEQALANGPGVRELQGMLNLLHTSMEQARNSQRLPVFEIRATEGAFGAGPGAASWWDNRFDLGLSARWDLSNALTARARARAADSRLQQVHLTYQDLCGKLTAGVEESHSAILSGRDQLDASLEQLDHARKAFDQAFSRLENAMESLPFTETLQMLRMLREAEHGYLNVLNAFDKAQLRLLMLLGPAADCH